MTTWTPEEFKAWAKTRKSPASDVNGKSEPFTQVPIKTGTDATKKALAGLIYDVLKLSPVQEFQFAPPRKFRFDFCFPEIKLAIEYEGLFSVKSGHTTVKGYTSNCSKYNLAAINGWKILRYTALNYREVLIDLPALLKTFHVK